jgi:hypothetical protein
VEEKTTWNSVPWNKNRSQHLKPFRTRNSVPWNKNRSKLSEFRSDAVSEENILFARAGFFVRQIFFMPFPSVWSLGIDSSAPWNASELALSSAE